MKLTGKLSKESRSLNAALSPRAGGGRVKDVVYGSAAGESVVNNEGVAIIPPYPVIGVRDGDGNNLVNNGIAIIPNKMILTNQNNYNNLSEEIKKNGCIYFLHDETPHKEILNPSNFLNKYEGSMSITAESDKLIYRWNGGQSIGACSYFPTKIPKEINRLYFSFDATTCYSASNPSWYITLGVKETYNPNNFIFGNDADWIVKNQYNQNNTSIESYIDLSSVNVDTYFMLCAHGWNVAFNEFYYNNGNDEINKIMFMDYEF